MKWNLDDIVFLHQPDVFTGTFDNVKMQARHEEMLRDRLAAIMAALDQETDPLKAMQVLNDKEHLRFFLNNEDQFRKQRQFEAATLFLYGRQNSPFTSGGDQQIWQRLFSACDRQLLFALGSPVTLTAATVYSGSVAGLQRGLSWTPDRQRAEGFASRWADPTLGGGQLYEVGIGKKDILIHQKRRHEVELILDPAYIATAEIRLFRP
jgi:hypothetical protein